MGVLGLIEEIKRIVSPPGLGSAGSVGNNDRQRGRKEIGGYVDGGQALISCIDRQCSERGLRE